MIRGEMKERGESLHHIDHLPLAERRLTDSNGEKKQAAMRAIGAETSSLLGRQQKESEEAGGLRNKSA